MVSDESFCINIINNAQYIVPGGGGGFFLKKKKNWNEKIDKKQILKW